ncbi:MAG: GntR family transcriptional regulator [Eubacteriales bacterium]|nr:GntR family transcriptional regulator [Eubacteriales bacterium]
MMKLDKRSNIPLYSQLKDLILERIASDIYPAGQQIPSELTLCEELTLSRPTVRQAIAELVSEGVLVIQKGKGTFVAAEPERLEIRNFNPFTYSLLASKSIADIEFSTVEKLKNSEALASSLGLPYLESQAGFWAMTWIIRNRGLEVGQCRSLIPVSLFPDFGDQIKSSKTMLDILANKYAYLPSKGQCQLAVRPASNDEAALLDVTRRSPILFADCRLASRSEHLCEIVHVIWRPDRVALNLEAGRS